MTDIVERETAAASNNRRIGLRIRLRRTLLGMTRQRLGEILGVTARQVQEYEDGTGRVRTSQLRELAELFAVPLAFFYADAAAPGPRIGFADALDVFEDDTASLRENRDLLRAYNRIADPAARKQALGLLESLAPEA